MLFLPNSALPPKASTTGIARGRSSGGHWLRARTMPVQPRTDSQNLWRQIFAQAKRNWLAIGPGGVGNIPVDGISPQQAWAIQAENYFGILQAGYIENGVQAEGLLVGCATPEAFQVMVQTTLAGLGLPPYPTPVIVTQYLAWPTSTYSATIGNFTVTVNAASSPDPTNPSLFVIIDFTNPAQGHPPANLNASGPTLTTTTNGINDTSAPSLTVLNGPATATATSSTLTFTQSVYDAFTSLIGLLLSTAGFTPAGYNVTAQPITANTDFTITCATGSNPGAQTVSGTITVTTPPTTSYQGVVLASPTAATLTGSLTLNLAWTDDSGPQSLNLIISATTGNASSALPPPTFAQPSSLSSTTVYDLTYTVIGFALEYQAIGGPLYPMSRNGVPLPGLWLITASRAYTSSYAKPPISSWSPILAWGPYRPPYDQVLAAWVLAFGPLPDSGDIAFLMQYCDPFTGCPGPALSCTSSWANGTLKGSNLAAWTGPKYIVSNYSTSGDIALPGSTALQILIQGTNGYGGTITFSVKPKLAIPTGTPHTTYALPPGVVFALSQPTLTIAPGDTTIYTVTATAALAGTLANYEFAAALETSDGIQSGSGTATFQLTGGSGVLPPPNYLTLDPGSQTSPATSPSSPTFTLTASNTGPDDIFASFLASSTDPALATAFTVVSVTVPAGTFASPGTATTVLTVSIPASHDAVGAIVQIEASAGANSAQCAVLFS